jgi:hypothetical protein
MTTRVRIQPTGDDTVGNGLDGATVLSRMARIIEQPQAFAFDIPGRRP